MLPEKSNALPVTTLLVTHYRQHLGCKLMGHLSLANIALHFVYPTKTILLSRCILHSLISDMAVHALHMKLLGHHPPVTDCKYSQLAVNDRLSGFQGFPFRVQCHQQNLEAVKLNYHQPKT